MFPARIRTSCIGRVPACPLTVIAASARTCARIPPGIKVALWRAVTSTSSSARLLGPARAFDAESTPPEEPDALKERYRTRLFKELGAVAVKRGHDERAYLKGVKVLEAVLGVFTPDMSVMKEAEWADMIVGADGLAKKMVIMKTHFPTLDTVHLILKKPKVFVLDDAELTTRCQQVCHLLKEAKNPGKIISDTPDLMEPAMVASALVTFKRKWPEKDPVQLLEEEGAYWLRFFSDTEVPLEPVYYDGKTWAVPAFDTEAKQQPWKKFIADKAKKEMERSKAKGFLF